MITELAPVRGALQFRPVAVASAARGLRDLNRDGDVAAAGRLS